MFENKLLKVFGPKREEVTGWRKLHSEKLHNWYSLADIIMINDEMGVTCSTCGNHEKLIKIFT
jgi:hypothetical protein